MADILADDNFRCIFLNENDRILTQISLKFVPRSAIDNKPALVQVMACRQTGDKPLPETMLTQFTDAYMRHWGEMSSLIVPWEGWLWLQICNFVLKYHQAVWKKNSVLQAQLWDHLVLRIILAFLFSGTHTDHRSGLFIPSASVKLMGGILVSPCLSVCPSMDRIVSVLYLSQY